MIQRIILDDFLAHKHTELALGPGVTVLTGPNNSGKSAMVEALRCVATNPPPRHVIRHGATLARVEVVLEDGTSVAWCRKKNTAWYELKPPGAEEPEYFRKLGRGMVPDEIREALRLDLVDLESGVSVDVHVGDQKKPIFLLDMDGADARMAEFFAASSESAHLMAMQKSLQSRNREAKTRERTLRVRLEQLAQGLDRLAPLPEITRRGMLARESGKAAQALEKALPELERALSRGRSLRTGLRAAARRSAATKPLAAPPQPWDAPGLERRIVEMARLRVRQDRSRALAQALATLTATPSPASTTELKQLVDSINMLNKLMKATNGKAASLTGLQAPPELFNQDPLSGLLGELALAGQRLEAGVKVAGARAERLAAVREDIRRKLDSIGSCPLCGGRLDAEAFTGGGASEGCAGACAGSGEESQP
ncbi:AAA family ATPase [Paucidesulfovibrio longus]|uniref:AAA family ATPase n=1 Tax=Paucidesulfovibrio longus TaxID=889 RepID=UPI0003B38C78|nr:AAA family ATPase [Paucidesulfovibrio longus]